MIGRASTNDRPGLPGSVVVIVGASSGVGRAAALSFAREGARVVLAARRAALLEEVRLACESMGTEALAVPTDAGDPDAVKALAEAAMARFGRIDVWINNAGVGAVGAFDETPVEAHDQVIRTNLLGAVHGAHAVLPHFKRQGSGVLINTNSLGGFAPAPYAVAYSASKVGLRGFSEALRGELSRFPHIHVCDVYPGFLDTPGVAHGANYIGRELKPMPLVKDPQSVADVMVSLACRPRRTVLVGQSAAAARVVHALAPGTTGWSMARFMEAYMRWGRPAPRGDGAVFEPQPNGRTIYGGWKRPGQRIAAAAALSALGLGLIALGRSRAHRAA